MSGGDGDDTSVRVAVRIRPQNAKEKIDMNQVCTSVEPSANQICLGKDKAFTFDYVFDMDATQEIIFSDVSKPLMSGCLEGYNATLLAYGQTGSGKTYTMGTGFEAAMEPATVGIIPRAVEFLFNSIDESRLQAMNSGLPPPDFKVIAQFLELYNEELIDLLDVTGDAKGRCKSRIRIHEDANGGIYITGASTRIVASLEDTIKCLRDGALCRSTGSTNMNAQSSRSHAIFTLYIRQQRVVKEEASEDNKDEAQPEEAAPTVDVLPEFETLSAKFHFVDLAGSERLKRTGATGDRAKEGISINCGLLALGNVISALGDVTKRGSHVPYRDSKLTRLLQDSLGGNSRTIMIACISPSDCDFMETLNALKYANRARNIRNKVMVNQDKTSRQIAVLRSRIAILEQELFDYKQGRRVVNADGTEGLSDLSVENNYLQTENEKMRVRVKALKQALEAVQARNAQLLADFEAASIKVSADRENGDNESGAAALDEEVTRVVEKYTAQVEDLRTRLAEAEAMAAVIQRSPQRPSMAPDAMLASASMTGSMFCMSTSMTSSVTAGSSIMSASFSGAALPRGSSVMSASDFGDAFLEDSSVGQPEPDLIAVAKMELAKQQQQLMRRQKGCGRKRGTTLEPCSGSDDDETEEMDVDEEADAEDDEDDEDEDDEKDKENLHESLAALTSDISLKQRLISELETKQRQLQAVRDHYEKQMTSLMEKIKETEYERDKVLANVNKVENSSEDRVRKIKEDFEKRLANLKAELRRMSAAKREHNRMQKEQQRREMQLSSLHRDLDEMKRLKVQLLKKVKEEAKRARQLEIAHDREVAQLRREKRIKDNTIRTLETEKRQRENVLRRKHEEVEALRRRKTYRPPIPRPNSTGSFERMNSARSAGNTPITLPPRSLIQRFNQRSGASSASSTPRTNPVVAKVATSAVPTSTSRAISIRSAKMKWDNLERSLTNVVSRRQTVSHFEQDMQNWVHEREKLGRKMEVLQAKLKSASDKQEQVNLEYEMANIRSQLERAQEQISECQTNIIELEETRDEPSTLQLFSRCNIAEARYLLERLFESAVSKGLLAQQMEEERKEAKAALESKAAEKEQALGMLRIALQQGADGLPFDMEELIGPERDAGENDADSLSESDQATSENTSNFLAQDRAALKVSSEASLEAEARRKQKARRLTQTPQELLGVERPPEPLQADSLDEEEGEEEEEASEGALPDSVLMPPPISVPSRKTQKEPSSAGPSPSLRRKQYAPSGRPAAPAASGASNLMTTSLYLPRSSGNDSGGDATPPLTPPLGATSPVLPPRSAALRADVNVFSRLTGGVSGRGSPGPAKGMIYAQTRNNSRSVLECTHVAEGHTKAVLDVDVTPTHMITGSKDRTAKLWDLTKMSEICILGAHHNNVSRVRYCPSQHLLFTVCSYYIKLWDDRATDKCIRTLLSSGLSQEGPPEVSHALRQNICPPGETNIMDLVLSDNGEEMFLATANSVKLWDLRRFCAVGKLHGNHQAPVMVLALHRGPNSSNRVVTGSKDHYIKVFSVPYGSCGLLTPSADLQPPHYDGIESLALREHTLFSGSRDTCIKKWNLAMPHQENVINNAHRDWIQGLCLLPNSGPAQYLLSGCRAGTLKLWNADDCAQLGDAQAHTSAINAVRTNGNLVFTASNDTVSAVKLWQVNTDLLTTVP